MRFWYRMSYDGGLNWTPLTWAPYAGWLNWTSGSYNLGLALDKDGYPHFASFLMMDTTTTVDLAGPNSGVYDYHLTAGGWVLTKIHGGDTVHTSPPSMFINSRGFATMAAIFTAICWLPMPLMLKAPPKR